MRQGRHTGGLSPAQRHRYMALAALFCLATLLLSASAWALTPDQIALVINKHVPDSLQLANYYMAKRDIPQGRIIPLDVPFREQMSYQEYQTQVVAPIRAFLEERKLKDKVTCLVTFYGVPFRIENRPAGKDQVQETAHVRMELIKAQEQIRSAVLSAQKQAKTLSPATAPADDMPATTASASGAEGIWGARAEQAMRAILQGIDALEPAKRAGPLKQFAQTLQQLGGSAAVVRQFAAAQLADPHLSDAERKKWEDLRRKVESAEAALAKLNTQNSTAANRQTMRQLVRENFGLFAYVRLLESQAAYLNNDQTLSATDNELALLWWNNYPRARWLINPLFYGFKGKEPPVLMVMRLDAPEPGTVRDMILSSLKAEHDGLKGRIVLDARGIAAVDRGGHPSGYGEYDQTIRNLAHLLQGTVRDMPLTFDDRPAVLPAHSVNSVALYCGWYSLRHYIPACQFNVGAVGFHVASFELVTLHSPTETGWVHGLLNDGVVATLGAVAEPYLSAFPRADDFFPLLLTGKLPLAEVYWKTNPMVSWRMCFIGDPLYNPFKNNPQLTVEDLPQRLRSALGE